MSGTGDLKVIYVDSDTSKSAINYAKKMQNLLHDSGYSVKLFSINKDIDIKNKPLSTSEVQKFVTSSCIATYNLEKKIENEVETENDIVIVCNSSTSMLAKTIKSINSSEERRGLYLWLDNFNYETIGLTRPIKNFLVSNNNEIFYEISKLFPKDYENIDPNRSGEDMSDKDIAELIFKRVEPLLPGLSNLHNKGRSNLINEYIDIGPSSFYVQKALEGISGVSLDISKNSLGVYMPSVLSNEDKEKYKETLSVILTKRQKIYSELSKIKELSKDEFNFVIDSCTPLSLTSESKLRVKGSLEAIQHKLSTTSEGRIILTKLGFGFIEQKQISKTDFGQKSHESNETDARVISCHPRNELDALNEILYSSQSASYNDLSSSLSNLSYTKKAKLYENTLPNSPVGPIYELEGSVSFIETPYISHISEWTNSQFPTPRYGYDVPDIIEKYNLVDEYLDCFDHSLSLYSMLQSKYDEETCMYACLGGHKTMWINQINAVGLPKLSEYKNIPTSKQILENIINVIEEKHPITISIVRKSKS